MNLRTVIPVGAAVALGLCAAIAVRASDHLDPPAIAVDPATDIADVYAFGTLGTDGNPGTGDETFVMVMTVAGEFAFDVRYAFQVDEDPSDDAANGFTNDSTASVHFTPNEDAEGPPCMSFAFRTLSFDSCALPPAAIAFDEETGDLTVTVDLPDPLPGVVRVFAGIRDDPFFFDLPAFRSAVGALEAGREDACLSLGPLCTNGFIGPLSDYNEGTGWGPLDLSIIGSGDFFAGGAVHAIVIEAPAIVVAGEGGAELSAYAATYRRAARLRTAQGDIERGPWIQVDRLAVPALSTGLIPSELKLVYNRDDVNNSYAAELGAAIVGLRTAAAENLAEFNFQEGSGFGEDRDPPAPFLGITDPTALLPLVDPDVVHLNTIPEGSGGAPTGTPLDPRFPTFPNGRTLGYDAMDTVLSLVLGIAVTDGVDTNDCAFLPTFPFLAPADCAVD